MRLYRRIDLLYDGCRSIRTHLCEPFQVTGVEAQTNHGIPTAALRLGHDAGNRVIACAIQLF